MVMVDHNVRQWLLFVIGSIPLHSRPSESQRGHSVCGRYRVICTRLREAGGRIVKSFVAVAIFVGATLLSACETTPKPVPDGYTGLVATLKDSAKVARLDKCGDFFFLNQYNGKDADNGLQASARDNQGTGMIFAVVKEFSRPVPARSATFFIVGRTHCAAPIMEMTGTVLLVGGKVAFTPEPDGVYVIKGELTPNHSAVWIEDEKRGVQVSNKLQINGLAKAGFFGIKGNVEEIPPPH